MSPFIHTVPNSLTLTRAINEIPPTLTPIRQLGLFRSEMLSTPFVRIARPKGPELVRAVPRGAPGQWRPGETLFFETPKLALRTVISADELKPGVVATRLAQLKEKIELTRESLQLGALQGKIHGGAGREVLPDIYSPFGLTRKEFSWDLGTATTHVGKKISETLTEMKRRYAGETIRGWVCLCSWEFMQALVYHRSIEALYVRFQAGRTYREDETNVEFIHQGIRFIPYQYDFGNDLKIQENEAILLPLGTKNILVEYFAPADYGETVNTLALPYYAKGMVLEFDKGWELEAQSNPLPLLTKPELVATLRAG